MLLFFFLSLLLAAAAQTLLVRAPFKGLQTLPLWLPAAGLLFCLTAALLPGSDSVRGENQALAAALLPCFAGALTGALAQWLYRQGLPRSRRLSRWLGAGMALTALVFLGYALHHPEAGWPWPQGVTAALYGSWLSWTAFLLAAPRSKKSQTA